MIIVLDQGLRHAICRKEPTVAYILNVMGKNNVEFALLKQNGLTTVVKKEDFDSFIVPDGAKVRFVVTVAGG